MCHPGCQSPLPCHLHSIADMQCDPVLTHDRHKLNFFIVFVNLNYACPVSIATKLYLSCHFCVYSVTHYYMLISVSLNSSSENRLCETHSRKEQTGILEGDNPGANTQFHILIT